jgi:hypothetical protein
MSKRINFRYARFFALSVVLLGVQAFAQFEVSPDHFDTPATKQAHRRTAAKSHAKAAPATTAVAARKKTTARKNKTAPSQPQTTAAVRVR